MIIRGILVNALRMSMTAKFAIKIFGTVRRVLKRTSNRQIILFPTIDPIITTVIIKMCDIFSTSWQELIWIVPFIAPNLSTVNSCKSPNVPTAYSLGGFLTTVFLLVFRLINVPWKQLTVPWNQLSVPVNTLRVLHRLDLEMNRQFCFPIFLHRNSTVNKRAIC